MIIEITMVDGDGGRDVEGDPELKEADVGYPEVQPSLVQL